jgi:hypothetical protein
LKRVLVVVRRNKPQLQIVVRPPSTTIQADRQAVRAATQFF